MRLFILFAIIAACALGAFAYSQTLPQWTDAAAFESGASKIVQDYRLADNHSRDETYTAYNQLYEAFATPRNLIHQVSLTVLALAAGGMLLTARGLKGLNSPPNKWLLLPIGWTATGLSFWGMVKDEADRFQMDISPPWYDYGPGSFIGMLILLGFMLALVIFHATSLIGARFNPPARLLNLNWRKLNIVVLTELILTLGLTAWATYNLEYWSLLAAPLWLYFYGSVLAIRAQAHSQPQEPLADA